MKKHNYSNTGLQSSNIYYCNDCGFIKFTLNGVVKYEAPSPLFDKIKYNNDCNVVLNSFKKAKLD
jgi:hypothetical protein